jgi:hypothetical protein
LTVWCIHSKHIENVLAAKRIRVCASEKGKPVVRRGRKAHGASHNIKNGEVAGPPNSSAAGSSEERAPAKDRRATSR